MDIHLIIGTVDRYTGTRFPLFQVHLNMHHYHYNVD